MTIAHVITKNQKKPIQLILVFPTHIFYLGSPPRYINSYPSIFCDPVQLFIPSFFSPREKHHPWSLNQWTVHPHSSPTVNHTCSHWIKASFSSCFVWMCCAVLPWILILISFIMNIKLPLQIKKTVQSMSCQSIWQNQHQCEKKPDES